MPTVERYFQHHVRNWIDEIGDNVTTKMLDVGCGTGHIGLWLAGEYPMITANCQDKDYDERHRRKELRIHGVDGYPPAINYLKQFGIYSQLTLMDLEVASLPLEKYDIAVAYGVMAHLERPVAIKVIQEMKQMSKHLIVTAPSQMAQHENVQNAEKIKELKHKSIWRCRDFESLGLNTRLLSYREDPDKMTYLNTFMVPWVFALSSIHSKLNNRFHFLNGRGDGIVAWR